MANDNMRFWDALKATDPKYTKPVTFGRKFTSINSQWQLQRMTEQFGPIGKGWGYHVTHGVERLGDLYILAMADVTIWWRDPSEDKVAEYGPIRGSAPLLEPARDKGKMLFEVDGTTIKMHLDDDAGKKAMTDALTKGLSHIGLSADVFLGLFEDNKYVQKVTAEYAVMPKDIHGHPHLAAAAERADLQGSGPRQSSAHGRELAASEPHLVANANGRQKGTTTAPAKAKEPTKAELRATKIKKGVDDRIAALRAKSDWTKFELSDFWAENKVWIDWMDDPKNEADAEYQRFYAVYADIEANARDM